MATLAKTIVATGASSGLGYAAISQLLASPTQPYRIILGARNPATTQAAYAALPYDRAAHDVTVLPLELVDLRSVQAFARDTLAAVGGGDAGGNIDYLFLNAGMIKPASWPAAKGSRWCDTFVVNHLSQHYLTHLLKEKLAASKARVVIVTSGGIRAVSDPSVLDTSLLAGATTSDMDVYCQTKFVQLLSAHYWRRALPACAVLAVSPGLIPGTALARDIDFALPANDPDAKSVAEGGANLLRAFFVDRATWPADEEQIFFTSWGEWWGTDMFAKTLDKELQAKWCKRKEEIEREEGLE